MAYSWSCRHQSQWRSREVGVGLYTKYDLNMCVRERGRGSEIAEARETTGFLKPVCSYPCCNMYSVRADESLAPCPRVYSNGIIGGKHMQHLLTWTACPLRPNPSYFYLTEMWHIGNYTQRVYHMILIWESCYFPRSYRTAVELSDHSSVNTRNEPRHMLLKRSEQIRVRKKVGHEDTNKKLM